MFSDQSLIRLYIDSEQPHKAKRNEQLRFLSFFRKIGPHSFDTNVCMDQKCMMMQIEINPMFQIAPVNSPCVRGVRLVHQWTDSQSLKNKELFRINFFFNFSKKNIVAIIRIGQKIWCLPYAGFLLSVSFFVLKSFFSIK